MEKIIKKFKFDLIIWPVLALVYFASRLSNLGIIPVFTDEAIYLRWSQIMANDAALRYMPLVDGKPPLFMWITSFVMRALPHLDLVLTGRLVSVFAGFGALIGMFFTSYVIFRNKKISYLAAFLYLLIPFTFFYDRFGLADSMLSMWGIWALGLAVILAKKVRLDAAMILGSLIGFGFLTKTPAVFYYGFFPVTLLFFDWKNKNRAIRLIKWGIYAILAVIISQVIYSVLRLFPLFYMIAIKNSEFVVTPRQFLQNPLAHLPGNIKTFLVWEAEYLSVPVAVLAAASLIKLAVKRDLKVLFLWLIAAGEFGAMSVFNSVIFPRYLLILTPVVLFLIADIMSDIPLLIRKPYLSLLVFVLIFGLPVYTDFKLVTDPPHAPIAEGDSNQYINSWPAGYGVREIREFLSEQSKLYPHITVGTEGTFGLMPYSLELYQKDYPNVSIKSYWPLSEKMPQELVSNAKTEPVYFVVYQRQDAPPGWPLELVYSFRQGISNDTLRLYKVNLER